MAPGAGGHGVGFHAHPAAYNALAFGAKRWLLVPSGSTSDVWHQWHAPYRTPIRRHGGPTPIQPESTSQVAQLTRVAYGVR